MTTSIPACPQQQALSIIPFLFYKAIQAPTLHSALAIAFFRLLRVTVTVNLPIIQSPCLSIKSWVPRKSSQVCTLSYTFWPHLINHLKIQSQGFSGFCWCILANSCSFFGVWFLLIVQAEDVPSQLIPKRNPSYWPGTWKMKRHQVLRAAASALKRVMSLQHLPAPGRQLGEKS